jgi:hypothetical protein
MLPLPFYKTFFKINTPATTNPIVNIGPKSIPSVGTINELKKDEIFPPGSIVGIKSCDGAYGLVRAPEGTFGPGIIEDEGVG